MSARIHANAAARAREAHRRLLAAGGRRINLHLSAAAVAALATLRIRLGAASDRELIETLIMDQHQRL